MNRFDRAAQVPYTQRVLTPRPYVCMVPIPREIAERVGAYTRGTLDLRVLEEAVDFYDVIAVRFTADVLEDAPREQVDVALTAGAPATWWQHLKEYLFTSAHPSWILRRWPVQRRAYRVTLHSTAHRLFPCADVPHPQLGEPVVIVEHDARVSPVGMVTTQAGVVWHNDEWMAKP